MEKGKQLQLIYDEVIEKKHEKKDLQDMYKDALANVDEYLKLADQIKELRDKKKMIELKIQNQLGRAWEKLEDLKGALDVDKVRMTDQAFTDLMDGRTVAVKDQFDNEYEPVWSVKFRKIK
jgi:hypothetical protein